MVPTWERFLCFDTIFTCLAIVYADMDNKRDIISRKLSPDSADLSLSCSDHVTANSTSVIKYKWEIDGRIDIESSGTLILTPGDEGDMLVTKCSAGDGVVYNHTKTWYILWETPTAEPLRSADDASESCTDSTLFLILGSVVGSFVVINLIEMYVIWRCWKKKLRRINRRNARNKRIFSGMTQESYGTTGHPGHLGYLGHMGHLGHRGDDTHDYTPMLPTRDPRKSLELRSMNSRYH